MIKWESYFVQKVNTLYYAAAIHIDGKGNDYKPAFDSKNNRIELNYTDKLGIKWSK